MFKITQKTRKLLFSAIVAGYYILSALVIPALHRLEVYHSHDTCCPGECRHEHDIKGQEQLTTCDLPAQSHNSEHCPICFFSKHLSGIKYHTILPTSIEIIKTADTLISHAGVSVSAFVPSCFDSRAPPA